MRQCGYCLGTVVFSPEKVAYVHADSGSRIPVTGDRGDFVSVRHNSAGTRVNPADVVELGDILRKRYVYFSADAITPDGSDTDGYGDGCEAGHGYTIDSGWYNPRWARFEVSDEFENALRFTWSLDDGNPAEWLAARITEVCGYVDSVNHAGGDVPDVSETLTAYSSEGTSDIETGASVRPAAHACGFTADEIQTAIRLMRPSLAA